jgi:hypothetical protein
MSAYVLDRKHFITIAKFVRAHGDGGGDRNLWVFHPEIRAIKGQDADYLGALEVANILLLANLESVAHRYSTLLDSELPIREQELYGPPPKAVELFGILRSLRYQSCERDDYNDSLAYAVLIAVLWKAGEVAAKQANADEWA